MIRIPIKGTIIPNDYKDIYSFFGVENTCPADIEKALKEAKGSEVVFEINSGGGAIFAGSEIYAKVRAYKGKKAVEIVGIAGSAASVIACAAKSSIAPTAMIMIHNVSGSVCGDWNDMAHEADVLKECDKSIAAAYIEKTGKSEEELLKLMDDESWFGAKKALEYGFVDEIMPQETGLYNSLCTILTQEQIQEGMNTLKGKAIEQERLNLIKMEVHHD